MVVAATVEDEEWNERLRILEDAKTLKKLAVFFLHPEKPVEVSPEATARCFFDRPSAPERVSVEEAEEMHNIMEDVKALKKLAVDYLHPERPVVTTDPAATARCFFDRPSAPERVSVEEAEERALILEEAKALKQLAVDYLHPERPVVTADSAACGRNFFTRASAPEQESVEDAEERTRILEEAKQLKKLAMDYHHPEVPIVTTDPTACGRNFFTRFSAPEQESVEEAEERVRILEEAKQLKKLAVDYHHPEVPIVTTDPAACGRNFFTRFSAPEQESVEDAEERVRILEEAKQLKKLAMDYHHPELPVVTTDPAACGRNFFTRFSAPEQESVEDAEERVRILEEAKQLKKLAVDYHHPELPVVTADPTACGRNFFTRASAPEQESVEEAEERVRILEEAKQLKKLAVDYHHPELPVVTTDPAACGRNFYTRFSAPEQDSREEADERALILEDARNLTKLAVDYLHPELPVITSDSTATARNYFTRASALGHSHMIHTFPPLDHDEHDHNEHVDHFGMDEDLEMEMFTTEIRHKLNDTGALPVAATGGKDSEEESNLSRSPSSVMLYIGESVYD